MKVQVVQLLNKFKKGCAYMKYCPNCNKKVSDISNFCPDCGGNVVERDNIPMTTSGAGYSGGFFKRLFHDEYGFTANRVLRGFAKFLMILAPIDLIALFIVGAALAGTGNEVLGIIMIISSFVVAFACFIGAVNLLWRATLGNNVAVMRQQSEKNNANKDNSSALPKL